MIHAAIPKVADWRSTRRTGRWSRPRGLAERLLAVSHFLDKSIGASDEAEAIHQLRGLDAAGAAAAIDLFEPGLSKQRRKRMSKILRKIRKRGGAVRDCDVHLEPGKCKCRYRGASLGR